MSFVRGEPGAAGCMKYSPQFHPAVYLAKAIGGALEGFVEAERFSWPDLRLLDLHDHNPAWKIDASRMEKLKMQMNAFRPKTLHRFVRSQHSQLINI